MKHNYFLSLLIFFFFLFAFSSCEQGCKCSKIEEEEKDDFKEDEIQEEKHCPELSNNFKRIIAEEYSELDLEEENSCSLLEKWKFINQRWYEQQKQMAVTKGSGWQITDSGILYKVIYEGIGDNNYNGRPNDKSAVTISYTGYFFNDESFDSSTNYSNYLSGFVPGFQESLKLMKKNAIYEVIIPYELGYGEDGGTNIPPYTTLQFRIELVEFWTTQ